MTNFRRFLHEKNMQFRVRHIVRNVGSKEGWHGGMRESCIEGSVLRVERELFRFIRKISLIKFMIKKSDEAINGVQWIIDLVLILVKSFQSSLQT
jgi:hypothetical protein